MKAKPILPHRHAIEDADDVIDYYREHAGTLISQNFASEVDDAYACLSRHPNIGSPRTALDLDIEGIKSWSLKRFPHQIYYRVFDFCGFVTGCFQLIDSAFNRTIDYTISNAK